MRRRPSRRRSVVRYLPDGSTDPRDTLDGLLTHEQLKPLYVEAAVRGYAYIVELAAMEEPPAIDLDLVCDLHSVCLGPIYEWAGRIRSGDLARPEVASPAWRIRADLRVLFDDLAVRLDHAPDDPTSERESVIGLVAWFQHRYIQVHPFFDFNGRTGRMLSTYLMLLRGLDYLEIRAETGADRARYVAAMRAGDDHDLGPLEDLIRDAMDDATAIGT